MSEKLGNLRLNHEVWKHCRRWLQQIGYFAEEDELVDNFSVSDLYFRLRNSTDICKILYLIDENIIDWNRVYSSGQQKSKYIMKRNSELFKEVCIKRLNISSKCCFQAGDLMKKEYFPSVLSTLSYVSQTQQSREKADPFFFDDDQCSLEKESNDNSFYDNTPSQDYPPNEPILHLPDMPYPDISMASTSQEQLYCMIQSEGQFVKTLYEEERFKEMVESFIGQEAYKTIFYKFEKLKMIHTNFYLDLRNASRLGLPPDFSALSKAFSKFWINFPTYHQYCCNYEKAKQTLKRFRERKDMTADCIKKCGKGDLDNILYAPIERINSYIVELLRLDKMLIKEQQFEYLTHVNESRDFVIRLAAITGTVFNDEKMKQSFETEIFPNIEKTSRDFLTLSESGRYLLDEEISFMKLNGLQRRKGVIYVFEEQVIVLTDKRKNRIVGEEKNSNCFEVVLFLKAKEVDCRSRIAERKDAVQSFTLGRSQKDCSYIFSCNSKNQEGNVFRGLRTINSLQFFKRATKHLFVPHTIVLSDNTDITGISYCDLCFNFLRGSYAQCYMCQKCNLHCHSFCMAVADLIPCQLEKSFNETWWKGEMSRREAQDVLASHHYKAGFFVVRWSANKRNIVITICDFECKVRNIVISDNAFAIRKEFDQLRVRSFDSFPHLVDYYAHHNISKTLPGVDAYMQYFPSSFNDLKGIPTLHAWAVNSMVPPLTEH